MAQSVALQTTRLPETVLKLQQDLGLTDNDAGLASTIIAERHAKANIIASLVHEYGLTIAEVGEIYDARDRINEELGAGTTNDMHQVMSLKQLALFRQRFPSVATDGESLAKSIMGIHERFQNSYLTNILDQLAEMAKEKPGALPEALADFLAGRMEYGWPDSGQD